MSHAIDINFQNKNTKLKFFNNSNDEFDKFWTSFSRCVKNLIMINLIVVIYCHLNSIGYH